jgi:hypothetical protein
VLILLGFVATDFVITKTLSAADAAEHLIHNPLWHNAPAWMRSQMAVTMLLLVVLGAMFLRGFREVIAVAVLIVSVYLALNALVIGSGLAYLAWHPENFSAWLDAVVRGDWHLRSAPLAGTGWLSIVAISLLFFPKLALGLSGFETGVAVMPLVRGGDDDDPRMPAGRIGNTRKLLLAAATIMSVFLLGSALVTSTLIPPQALRVGGAASNRALAYLAHAEGPARICPLFGQWFGTVYDASTVAILWFAGASAMSGLLNLVPRYLPRYGMAPKWAAAVRPLVMFLTAVNLLVTWIFDADVNKQGGAYATGVMVLMTSASLAVVIDCWRKSAGAWIFRMPWRYTLMALVFCYTTVAIVIEKPDGIKIAGGFIAAVLVFSMVSRTSRSTELRFERFEFIDEHSRLLWETLVHLDIPVLVPHRPGHRPLAAKEKIIRRIHRLGPDEPLVFVEASLGDTSEFLQTPTIEVAEDDGRFVIRVTRCVSIAHAVATIALELCRAGKPPEVHFGWSDESPLAANLNFILFGQGNVPWLVRELIQKAEPDPARRPRVIIG